MNGLLVWCKDWCAFSCALVENALLHPPEVHLNRFSFVIDVIRVDISAEVLVQNGVFNVYIL
jgi:hypothetical protein